MKLTIDMPWERDLSVNHCRMGPQGNWHLKPHVEAWMAALSGLVRYRRTKSGPTEDTPRFVPPELVKPVNIIVDFGFPDRRKRDSHNYFKVVADAVAAGLGIDDKDIRISTGSVTVDRENAGFSITVEDKSDE